MFILIAILHSLPPILGAMIGGRKGLMYGTVIGAVLAVVCGAVVFTIFDLLGVFAGYVAGSRMLEKSGR